MPTVCGGVLPFSGDASRFLRATVGVVVLGLFFAAARLLRPAPPQPMQTGRQELEKAYAIVRNSVRAVRQSGLAGR